MTTLEWWVTEGFILFFLLDQKERKNQAPEERNVLVLLPGQQ
jgi:hypothetical protein